MHTQLKVLPKSDQSNTFLAMAIRFIDLAHQFNDSQSEVEQNRIESEIEYLVKQASRKFDQAVLVIKNCESQAQFFRDIANRMMRKACAAEEAGNRLRNYLIKVGSVNRRLLLGQIFKGSLFTKKSVERVDLDQLPKKYTVEKITINPDKRLILNDIDNGISVPGTRIVEKTHLRIS